MRAANVKERPIAWCRRRTGGKINEAAPKSRASRKEKREIKEAAASGGAVAVER